MFSQSRSIRFNCPANMKGRRFVVVTHSTQTVAYCGAGVTPHGVTVENDQLGEGIIDVYPIVNLPGSVMIEVGEAVSAGASIASDSQGRAININSSTFGTTGASAIANIAAQGALTAGDIVEMYKVY